MSESKRKTGKQKVLELKPKELRFPAGDPRNDMTMEEIEAIARREDDVVNRHLAIMAKNVQPPCPVQEEDEDDEEFEVDLAKGVAKQTIAQGVIIKGEPMAIKGDYDGDFISMVGESLKPLNPYEGIVTEALVRKAVIKFAAKMEEYSESLQLARIKAPMLSDMEALDKQIEDYFEKITQLRRSLKRFPDTGVDYDKIPEWAVGNIERNVREAANQLADLLG
jgi:hypothetical protein